MSEPATASLSPDPPPESPAPFPSDRYAVLRNRDFGLYVSGRFIASFGQQMLGTAVSWELFERTGSALILGFVGLAQITPLVLLTLPAGHVADQHDRRNIIVWTQVLIALSCAGLTFVSWTRAPVPWTYVCLSLGAVARAFLWPASTAILPQIVPRAQLADAVTWNSGSFQISAASGPFVGGFVIWLCGGATVVYAFNVVAALLCSLLLSQMKSRPSVGTIKGLGMTLSHLAAGMRFVFRTPIILATITLDLFAVLLGGATALLPVYAKTILHVGPAWQGGLYAMLPVGSATMAILVAHLPPMRHAGRALLLAVAGFGVATVVFGLSRSIWLSLAMMFVCGAMDNISVIVRQTLVQILTPDELRGRVSAVNMLFIGSSNEFGRLESGCVAYWLGPIFAVVSGGIGTVLVVVATALIWPEMRRYGRLDGEDSPPPLPPKPVA